MRLNQKSQPLAEAIDSFIAREPAYFCIPGHRFERGISKELVNRFGERVFRYDLTETNGLDDLHASCGAIREAQSLAAELYGAQYTRFLVNGTTCGIEALMLAAAGDGGSVILARNMHRSAVSGLILSGAKPYWMLPEVDVKFGFCTEISRETLKRSLEKNPAAKAVFVVSPTYYGTLSDIKGLAEICHAHGIPLIVDEAHGAHLYFNDLLPAGALKMGADAVVMSAHKTLGSMTQSSFLHINSTLIDIEKVDEALRITQSSSPSYILMTSLDATRAQMAQDGYIIMNRALELSLCLRSELKKIDGIEVFGAGSADRLKEDKIDSTRVVFSANNLGLSGYELSDILFDQYSIAIEMADMTSCVAVVTGANNSDDISRLIEALRDISDKYVANKNCRGFKSESNHEVLNLFETAFHVPQAATTPREAFFAKSETIEIKNAVGRISAQSFEPYPPGIALINPGEIIDEKIIAAIDICRMNNIKMHGALDESLRHIRVVCQQKTP